MYRIDRNNFHRKEKNNNIETPKELSQFIYSIVSSKINKKKYEYILDPCVGTGSLLDPFIQNGYKTIGIDIIIVKECPVLTIFSRSHILFT